MRPEHIDRLTTLSRPAVSADGWVVVAATRPDFTSDSYVGQLWKVYPDGSPARRITRGFHDSAPRLSPDGRLIAFLRGTPGEPPQLAVVPSDGGEPAVITDRKLGVGEFAWAGNDKLVFVSQVPEEGRYGTLEGVGAGAEDPRRLKVLTYMLNGEGWTIDKRKHLFVVDVPDPNAEPPIAPVGRAVDKDAPKPSLVPEAKQLTSDDADYGMPAPAGDKVIATRQDGVAPVAPRTELVAVPLAGGEPVKLLEGVYDAYSPVVLGEDVLFIGVPVKNEMFYPFGADGAVYKVGIGGGEPVRLTDPTWENYISLFDGGPDHALGVLEERGLDVATKVYADGRVERPSAPERVYVQGVAEGPQGAVVASVATVDSPGELAVLGENPRVITDFAARLHEVWTPVVPQELIATSPDGQEVHGWVLLPEGEGPHPVLLNIHGGPFTQYPATFFDEVQVYVGAGYGVVMCNPRGASGYGEAFGQAIQGDFGNLDKLDIMSFLDHALAVYPQLDADRVGVMGGSYGGYMTAWLVGTEHRWKGAIVERGYLDMKSFVGESDIGWFFTPASNGTDPDQQDRQSPLLLTGQVTTPTLVLHSEQDQRCPVGIALRYYTELKLNGVDAEMLVFPGETHELSRSGKPWHRKQRFDAVLDWWARKM
jgi:dipeptidyl aminopeptidase/acylaminoacyl peptidase